MTDVHDLLARTHDALGETGTVLDDARHEALLTGIRRRRRRRHAAETLGVAALAVVLGAGGWLGLQGDGTPQPAESTAPTAEATPAPTAAPTGAAAPVPAPDAPGLVPASVLPPGTLEAATPGWVLTTQRPVYLSGDPVTDSDPTAHVVDLVSPTGERYRVVDLPTDRWTAVVRWDAGSTQALVRTSGGDGRDQGATLDLTTGALTPLDGLDEVSGYVGRTGQGLDLWTTYTGDVLVHDGQSVVRQLQPVDDAVIDRTGLLLAGTGPVPGADAGDGDPGVPVVVDVRTGAVTAVPAADTCRPFGWSGSEVLLTCWEITPEGPRATGSLRYDTATPGAAPRALAVEGDIVGPTGRGAELPDGRVVATGDPYLECTDGWGVVDPAAGTFTRGPLPGDRTPSVVDALDGAVYLTTVDQCSGDGGPLDLHRVDLATGATVELSGVPGTTDLPPDAVWISAMTSWVVGRTTPGSGE